MENNRGISPSGDSSKNHENNRDISPLEDSANQYENSRDVSPPGNDSNNHENNTAWDEPPRSNSETANNPIASTATPNTNLLNDDQVHETQEASNTMENNRVTSWEEDSSDSHDNNTVWYEAPTSNWETGDDPIASTTYPNTNQTQENAQLCDPCWKCNSQREARTTCVCPKCDDDDNEYIECEHCHQHIDACQEDLCPSCGICREACTCTLCTWCGKYEHVCECKPCVLCQKRPLGCRCVGPDTQRFLVPSQADGVNVFNLSERTNDAGNALDQTIVLHGKFTTVITMSDSNPKKPQQQPAEFEYELIGGPSMFTKFKRFLYWIVQPIFDFWIDLQERRKYQSKVREYTKPGFSWPSQRGSPYTYVRTPADVCKMVDQLAELPLFVPHIGIDMEASNLGHKSGLCLLQIRDGLNKETFLVDLLVLQKAAFDTPGTNSQYTLRTILENSNIRKLIYDVRQDSCALYAQAGIKLRGMIDLQIMYMLTKELCPGYRTGMSKAVELELKSVLEPGKLARWLKGKHPTYPEDKSISVWQQRPISPEFQAYAAGDVEILGELYQKLSPMLSWARPPWVRRWTKVEIRRTWVTASQWVSSGSKISDGFERCFVN